MFSSRSGARRTKGQPAWANVLRVGRTGNHHHTTEKPVELLRNLLEADQQGDRGKCPVVDPFLGSGSTLLACEQLGRVCTASEIEPGYVDVAIERWQAMTSREAVLGETGETFDAIRKARSGGTKGARSGPPSGS